MSRSPRIIPLRPEELTDEMRNLVALPLRGHQGEGEALSDYLAMLLRHPGLYRRYAPFAGKLLVGGKLSGRHRELAILRNAWLCKAPFEWGEHVAIAHREGIGSDEIERVIVGSTADGWEPLDRAIVHAAEELHADDRISEATWRDLAVGLDARQLIELPMLIGAYRMIAWVQNSLEVPLRDGNAGLAAR